MGKKTKRRKGSGLLLALISIIFIPHISLYAFLGHDNVEKAKVKWTPCPLSPANGNEIAECTQITIPLRHKDPGGPKITVAVKRKLGTTPHKRQLWFLDGGPGDSGCESLAALSKVFSDIDDLDLYTFDHRGVGGTHRLDCPEQQRPESEGGREILASEREDCIRHIRDERNDLDALAAIIWVMIFFRWRLGGILLSFLFDYRAHQAITLALFLPCLQIGIGVLLLRLVR